MLDATKILALVSCLVVIPGCQSDLEQRFRENAANRVPVDGEPEPEAPFEADADTPTDSDAGAPCDGQGCDAGPTDLCPEDPSKTAPGVCGCDAPDVDTDEDGVFDCADECPEDPRKSEVGICGCGIEDRGVTVADECEDECPDDPDKSTPGTCGCDVPDVDSDEDGALDCEDECPADPDKGAPGACGCGVPDVDSDEDGALDCADECPDDPAKTLLGSCGCGEPDTDGDGDEVPDCIDECVGEDANTDPTLCGCSVTNEDSDGDGVADCADECPDDPDKLVPGTCDCGTPDLDSDGDGSFDCVDACSEDPEKLEPGVCGCGIEDEDSDGDGLFDCEDGCDDDPLKSAPGVCGCGVAESADEDDDGTLDCADECPNHPLKSEAGDCGCEHPDTLGSNGVAECLNLTDALVHRYTFNGAGSTVPDSVGTAHGTVVGGTLPGTGVAALSNGVYVDLPNGLLSGIENASIEAWFTRTAAAEWARLFDFGSSDAGEGNAGVGTSYLFFTPQTAGVARLAFKPSGGIEVFADAGAAIPLNTLTHVVVVADDANDELRAYRDGALAATLAWTGTLSQLNTLNNWLGRSQYGGDAYLTGSINEFRIYAAALDASQVQYSFTAGREPTFF